MPSEAFAHIARVLSTIRGRLTLGRLAAVVAPLVVICVGIGLHAPLLWGDLPLNHDHPALVLRAWITCQQIAAHGTSYGFSPIMFAGNPADGLHPVGADLLVGFFRVASFGLASWETAYCWAFLLAILAYPGALYVLANRIAGPMAGMVAGLLSLVDRGDYLQSGWDFTVNWGVWPMGLSFALCLWSIWALDRLADRPSKGNTVALAALAGGALVTHPMALPIMGIIVPVQIAWTAASKGFGKVSAWLPSALLGLVMGGGLAAFWYLPFMAHSEWIEPLGLEWQSFYTVLGSLPDGSLLEGFAPAFVFLGIVGLFWAAFRREPLAGMLLLATGLILYVSSTSFLMTFDVLAKLPAIANLQMERFSYAIRAGLLIGTGTCVALLLREFCSRTREHRAATRAGWLERAVRWTLAGLVLLPFFTHHPILTPRSWFAPLHRLVYASGSTRYASLHEAADALSHMDRAGIGRVGLHAERHDHLLMLLPVYTGLPVFKFGFTPDNNYRYKPESAKGDLHEALGISHEMSIGPLIRKDLEEVGRFGEIYLYRVMGYARHRVTVKGPGKAEILRDDPQDLDIRLVGTGPGSEVIVHVSHFALWRASLDGRPVKIEGASVGDSPPMFMKAAVEDGLLELRYRAGKAEWTGASITLLALASLVFILVIHHAPRPRAWWERVTARWQAPVARATSLASAGAALVAIAFGGFVLIAPRGFSVPDRQVVADLSQRLPHGSVEVVYPDSSVPCRPWEKDRFTCMSGDWNWVGPTILTAGGLIRKCVWMHPVDKGILTLRLPDSPLGTRLEGQFGLADAVATGSNKVPVKMHVWVDDRKLLETSCPPRLGWFDWSVETPTDDGKVGDVTVQVEVKNAGRRHFCFTIFSTRAKR